MILLTSFYVVKNRSRFDELVYSLQKNISNAQISKIILLCENELAQVDSDKVEEILVNKRPKFSDFVRVANRESENDVKIIANSDIYFDDTLQIVPNSIKSNEVYCLTRWDEEKGSIQFYNNFKSQDAWFFQDKLTKNIGDYFMGLPGCDNRFAKELLDSGRKIKNPSLTIRAIHVHGSNLRNYNKSADRVIGEYAYPLPTEICNHKTRWGQIKEKDIRLRYLHRKWRNDLDGISFSLMDRLMARLILILNKFGLT